MNEAEIRKYASLMRELDLTGIEIDERNGVIRLEREPGGSFLQDTGAAPAPAAAAPVYTAPAASAPAEAAAPAYAAPAAAAAETGLAAGEILESVTSPTVGIFYAAPAENADPYVKAGDTVHKGDVLCIIEAMKLMNEVLAEKDGVIEAVCVQNGQVVEYGTELFKIKELSA